MKSRDRADRLLVRSGEAADGTEARGLIMGGKVLWLDARGSERKVESPGQPLPLEASFRVKGRRRRFVSRAGEKLDAALERFGLDVAGAKAIDLGISTGGFTDCLLQRGAREVWGVDVAYGVVADGLRRDPRVRLLERTHVNSLRPERVEGPADLLVGDLSFIRLERVLPSLPPLLRPGAPFVLLVKPQFEVDASALDKGIVRDSERRREALASVEGAAAEAGFRVLDGMESPVHGTKGNVEWLMFGTRRT